MEEKPMELCPAFLLGYRMVGMEGFAPLFDEIRKSLDYGDLSFRDFMELALYHPRFGYYNQPQQGPGKEGDFVTSPHLSPLFAFALSRLIQEFSSRIGDGLSVVVDIGCGEGRLLRSLSELSAGSRVRFAGVDRTVDIMIDGDMDISLYRTIEQVPRGDAQLFLSNELFDAFPFTRLVQRGEHLHELWVHERDGILDWTEHEAPAPLEDYFAERGIELREGQFADISEEWGSFYGDLCRRIQRGLMVTFDYGFLEQQLFDPRIRRFGTAAAYSGQQVHRDLLRDPGKQDLTAHINFSDLIRAGEREGMRTLFFDHQNKFLLLLGAAEHPLLRPITEAAVQTAEEGVGLLEERENAKKLLLPDGIGHDIRVLVQEKGMGETPWSFERKLF